MRTRRVATIFLSMFAILILFTGTALAHHCINPKKPSGAGVNYTVSFDGGALVFTQTGPGKGIGGFATIEGLNEDVHTIGNSGVRDAVGNPNMTAEQACDEKGIDLLGCP